MILREEKPGLPRSLSGWTHECCDLSGHVSSRQCGQSDGEGFLTETD